MTVCPWALLELARWCRKLGIHVNPQPAHMCPDAGLASRIVIAADQAGLPVAAARPEARAAYRRNTDAAVEAGVFGSPSYVYRGEVFWGQDRLDMLEEAVAG